MRAGVTTTNKFIDSINFSGDIATRKKEGATSKPPGHKTRQYTALSGERALAYYGYEVELYRKYIRRKHSAAL